MNKFRNILLAEDLPTEDVDELLLKVIDKSENKEFVIIPNKNSTSYRKVGDYLIPKPHIITRKSKYHYRKIVHIT
ncbi:MAG: hypothetical protein IKJ88_03435 [Clostridia bacterium]|nr:hypothetical protein [Clostridia bacterium]